MKRPPVLVLLNMLMLVHISANMLGYAVTVHGGAMDDEGPCNSAFSRCLLECKSSEGRDLSVAREPIVTILATKYHFGWGKDFDQKRSECPSVMRSLGLDTHMVLVDVCMALVED